MRTAMGFLPAKVLLVAVKLELFTLLARGPRTAEAIQQSLGLHDRALYDFLDTLVALGCLERDGLAGRAVYRNAPDADAFLDREKSSYIGGLLTMANDRLYGYWADFEEALRTGEPQNEAKRGEADLFDEIYNDPVRMRVFLEAMAGAQRGAFVAFAEKFDFSPYRTLCDVGGALAALCIEVARRHDRLQCITADLAAVEPLARQSIDEASMTGRVKTAVLDFWQDPFPAADVLTMGNILHDWNLEQKKLLIRKAHDALNDGGVLVIIENIIDDERRSNVFGLLMSLNMLIETRGGFDFTGADFADWAKAAGFRDSEVIPLAGPTSAAVAYK